MLKKITINHNFIKKDRILNGNFKDQFELTFKKGINVLTAPNGSGKTTIMNSINNVMLKNKPEDGFDVETFYEEDDKPKPWFIFSMNNMTAQEQISQISPFDEETYADIIFNEDFNIVDFCEKNDSYLDLLKKRVNNIPLTIKNV